MKAWLWLMLLLVGSAGLARAHAGHFSGAPWHACDGLTRGSPCTYEDETTRSRGTCQSISDALLCVRNRPVEQVKGLPKLLVGGLMAAVILLGVGARRLGEAGPPRR
jgi:hypothetical protein